jgi:hypothetical protein
MKLMQNFNAMNRFFLLIALINIVILSEAQEYDQAKEPLRAKNSVYASAGGPGIYFSVIYERHIIIKKKYSLGIKGGIGTSFSSVLFPGEFNFPIGILFLYGKKNSHLDFSLNVTNYLLKQYDFHDENSETEIRLLFVPSIAYRYQKPEGGFMAKIGFSPVIHFNSVTNTYTPWIDIGIGWAF